MTAFRINRIFPIRIGQITAVILNCHIKYKERLAFLFIFVALDNFLVTFLVTDITNIFRIFEVIDRQKLIKAHTLIRSRTVPVSTAAWMNCFTAITKFFEITRQRKGGLMHKLLIHITSTWEKLNCISCHCLKLRITGSCTKDRHIISSINGVLIQAMNKSKRITVIINLSDQRIVCKAFVHDQNNIWLLVAKTLISTKVFVIRALFVGLRCVRLFAAVSISFSILFFKI